MQTDSVSHFNSIISETLPVVSNLINGPLTVSFINWIVEIIDELWYAIQSPCFNSLIL